VQAKQNILRIRSKILHELNANCVVCCMRCRLNESQISRELQRNIKITIFGDLKLSKIDRLNLQLLLSLMGLTNRQLGALPVTLARACHESQSDDRADR